MEGARKAAVQRLTQSNFVRSPSSLASQSHTGSTDSHTGRTSEETKTNQHW